jgi:hypothetical protein
MMFRALAGVAALVVSSIGAAAPLWQNVNSGMTPSQVKLAQPLAVTNLNPGHLASGATCDLTIQSLNVGTYDFSVCFYMMAGRLSQVTLKALSPNRPMFQSTVDLLRAKYGPELGAGNPLCREGMLTVCEAKWMLKSGVNVDALLMQVQGTDPIMNINYQTTMAMDTSKL